MRNEDALAGLLVEVAGRLVREEKPGPVGERARHRDALLLAAGEAGRPKGDAIFEPDLFEQAAAALAALGRGDAGQRHGQGDVVLRGERWDEVEALEDRADVLQPVVGELPVTHLVQLASARNDRALRRTVEAAQQRQQRRLATT